jgi:hypothetical protein
MHSTAIEKNSLSQGETKSILIAGYISRSMEIKINLWFKIFSDNDLTQ